MRKLLSIAAIATMSLWSCQSTEKQTNASADEALITEDTQVFEPEAGMPLSQLSEIPGVTWSFETIRGICSPDTSVLWVRYDDVDFLTNVRGIGTDFSLLTNAGKKKLKEDTEHPQFSRVDFSELAVLSYDTDNDLDTYRALNDTVYQESLNVLKNVVRDFFLSGGDTRYMSTHLAGNWRVILAQAEAEGDELPNPFNRSAYFEIEPSTLTVEVPDPNEGIVEVSGYCNDPFTLGRPGWAYWTVVVCSERGQYKIKEMPAQHRKFAAG